MRLIPGFLRSSFLSAILATQWPLLAHAENIVQWTTNYYPVTGATLGEIRQSINQARPWKGRSSLDGLTEWQVNWQFDVSASATGCQWVSFNTKTTIKVTLPGWSPPTNTPPEVKEAWRRFFTALAQHEAGHAQIAQAAAKEVARRATQIGEATDCDSLKKTIHSVANQVIEDHRKQDKDYDERTEHGARQGAFLPRFLQIEKRTLK